DAQRVLTARQLVQRYADRHQQLRSGLGAERVPVVVERNRVLEMERVRVRLQCELDVAIDARTDAAVADRITASARDLREPRVVRRRHHVQVARQVVHESVVAVAAHLREMEGQRLAGLVLLESGELLMERGYQYP